MDSRERSRSLGLLTLVLTMPLIGCQPAGESPPAAGQSETASRVGSVEERESRLPPEPDWTTAELLRVPLGLPPLSVPADNPMTPEKIQLGKRLFFDPRLSKDGTISCATCHDPTLAWADSDPTSAGIGGQRGPVNASTVLNAAYAAAQLWDGRAASLEQQALGPIENPVVMGHRLDELVEELAKVPRYVEGFQKAFGTGVTREGIAQAIASFERTVLSGNSPYDRFKAGEKDALTESQRRGLELFTKVGCDGCHAPALFSSYRYYNAGIGMGKDNPDEGRRAVTGRTSDMGKFRVPALREAANTGPYFHDGSVDSLDDAVAIMAGGGKDNPNLSSTLEGLRRNELSDRDRKDLVEFIKALSGDYPGKESR